jgi:Alginate export
MSQLSLLSHQPMMLVPSLLLLSSALVFGADAPGPNLVGNSSVTEITPGKIQGGSRQVYIQGLVDLDALQQKNYYDGNSKNPNADDYRSEGWYRAELGTRIAVDDRIEVQVTLAGQGVMGNGRATDQGSYYNANFATDTGNTASNSQSGSAVLDDAFIRMKNFLNYREISIDAGRQPVSWNLRRNHGAFLYDSRADYSTITSWDGLRATYNLDTLNITPYVFRMPDNSQLYGGALDWEPAKSGDDRLFFSGSANMERNVRMRDGTVADELITYYVGGDLDFSDFEIFGEFAMQDGDYNSDTKFAGFAASGGLDWHIDTLVLGLQYDFITGDNNTSDKKNRAFVNNWEAVSDTYIVESEKFGELSRLLQGNLRALKGKLEYALDAKKRVRLKTIYGYYKTDKALAGSNSRNFGQELDLSLAWDFTPNATITILGGLFKPEGAYEDASKAAADASDDYIYLVGANLLVKF